MKYKVQIRRIVYDTYEYETEADTQDEALDEGIQKANEKFGDEWLEVHAIENAK